MEKKSNKYVANLDRPQYLCKINRKIQQLGLQSNLAFHKVDGNFSKHVGHHIEQQFFYCADKK